MKSKISPLVHLTGGLRSCSHLKCRFPCMLLHSFQEEELLPPTRDRTHWETLPYPHHPHTHFPLCLLNIIISSWMENVPLSVICYQFITLLPYWINLRSISRLISLCDVDSGSWVPAVSSEGLQANSWGAFSSMKHRHLVALFARGSLLWTLVTTIWARNELWAL